ncbi:MAG: MATE family efflux transporter [Gammaproteobacteria bacterium]|nr:MATE family efflux transporter [Gammaproteobacteria bacterium]MDX2462019.1 MATE family efflux transporter [Gammaproteobacteria bacterium]
MSAESAHLSTRPAARSIGEHLRRTLHLAVPVMLGRIGILIMVAVDTAMTGHRGPVELAYYALALAPQIPMLLVGIGLLLGTVVLTAQADGAGDTRACGRIWRIALVHAILLGLLFAALCQGGEHFLVWSGQSPELAHGGARVLVMLGWGLPGMLLFSASTFWLEGISRPLPGMFVMLAANILNVALNWVFIDGNLGAPALGAEGAALGTTIVRWFMFAAIATYVWTRLDRQRYGLALGWAEGSHLGKRLRRIGYPMGLAHGLEASAFSSMTLFAGLRGAVEVSGYLVAMNLVATVFMGAIGFATAASVRVANAVGRHDAHGARAAGWVAVGAAAALMILLGVIFFTLPGVLSAIYASDPRITAVAVPTLLVAAFVLLPDGIQAVLMGALRGTADVWPATALYLISFWGVMVPCGYYLGVTRGGGAPALMQGILIGCLLASVLMGWRFHVVSQRAVNSA